MKKVGIIGGAGPLASALLYETFIQESYILGRQVPEMILINYPFSRGLSLLEAKKNKNLIHNELNYCIQFLEKNGAEIGLLACNTLHLFLKQYSSSSIQFYQLPQLVVQAAQSQRHNRLLVLGTQNTCHSNLYQMAGIHMIYPSTQNQFEIDCVIDRILEGKILKEDASLVSRVIEASLQQELFDGVILGCTDFPVLHHRFPISSPKPIYDSIKIPAKTLIGLI